MRSTAPALGLALLAATAFGASALDPQEPAGRRDHRPVSSFGEIGSAIRACWRVPAGLRRLERLDVTVRFSLRRDGSVFEGRRVTFASLPVDASARSLLAQSALDALNACSPLTLGPGFGEAIAGRPLTIRLIHRAPQGQGA